MLLDLCHSCAPTSWNVKPCTSEQRAEQCFYPVCVTPANAHKDEDSTLQRRGCFASCTEPQCSTHILAYIPCTTHTPPLLPLHSCSFDYLKDDLGAPRSTFPHQCFMVAGTQASTAKQNYVAFLRLANLGQGRYMSAGFSMWGMEVSALACAQAFQHGARDRAGSCGLGQGRV